MKTIYKKLNLDSVEEGDLVQTGEENDEISENAYSIVAMWNCCNVELG
ncbi:hypothetical protein [Bacillus sp. 37MA]|nr:hypothetical protein [Bacillus sp. 37MA]